MNLNGFKLYFEMTQEITYNTCSAYNYTRNSGNCH